MDIAILNFDWRICVVVTPDNLANLPASLNSIARNSVSTDHIVLACDKPSVRHALKDVSIPVRVVFGRQSVRRREARIALFFWSRVFSSRHSGMRAWRPLDSGCLMLPR
jgi:hypothetical protein